MKRLFAILLSFALLIPSNSFAVEKTKIAVAGLQSMGGIPEYLAKTTSDLFQTELFKTGYFELMERDQIEKLLKEKEELPQLGITTDNDAAKVGQLLGVQYILIGSISRLDGTYVISVRLVDVMLGKLKAAETEEAEGEGKLKETVKQLSKKIAEQAVGVPEKTKKRSKTWLWVLLVLAAAGGAAAAAGGGGGGGSGGGSSSSSGTINIGW